MTRLHHAVASGDADRAAEELAIDVCDVEVRDADGMLLLHPAPCARVRLRAPRRRRHVRAVTCPC